MPVRGVHSPKCSPNKACWTGFARLFIGCETIGVVGGMKGWNGWRWLLAALVAVGLSVAVHAAGPVETSIFAVQGVDVDVTAKDASAAKDQALMDVQVKAFKTLVERLGTPEIAAEYAEWTLDNVAPFLRSLSIEKESSAPGRYIGTFTVRFMPGKMQALMAKHGVTVPTLQAKPVIVLPVWQPAEGPQLWEDNPWRKAWIGLGAEQAMVPMIVPIGDLEDSTALTADDAVRGDPLKIEAVRRRYDAPGIVVATATPAEGGVRVLIQGETDLGKVNFDKVYTAEDGTLEGAMQVAIKRFAGAMTTKYKQDVAKLDAEADAKVAARKRSAVSVAVPFSSPTEWNRIRSRILATPNVVGVDVATLSGDGAVVKLLFTNTMERLQNSMQSAGLSMSQIGGTWVIQPL
jgi:Uncharacterized protein conserved in bacteria (DUF2066)